MPHHRSPLAAAVCVLLSASAYGDPLRATDPSTAETRRVDEESEDDVPGSASVGETVVTASRRRTPTLDTPWSAETIDAERILAEAYRTTPQAMRDVPGIFVQETSYGQGSPYIRGFTGFRTLLLVDGIRINHSAMREGPNQYWSTLDPLSVARYEVVKGPGSSAWGSDAIGGTVQALTKSPFDFGPGVLSGEALYRYATADRSHVGHVDLAGRASDTTGLWLGLSVKDFDDVRGGDSTGKQPNTGYDEWDGAAKLEHWTSDETRIVLGWQRVEQNNVPRTHSTIFAVPFEGTTVGSDRRRDLDQDRELLYAQLLGDGLRGAIERFRAGVSWQRQDETRNRVRGNLARERQGFDLDTLGFLLDATTRETGIGTLTFGADWYHDEVDSFSTTNPVQGPVADDASYDLVGVFLEDELDLHPRLTMTLGGRFEYAAADAESVLDPVSSTETSIEDDWSNVVGSVRFLFRLSDDVLHAFAGVSQGFRAPNLSDLTRFDTARSNEFEIPAPGLDPEHFTQYEVGLKQAGERFSSQIALFYTDVEDQIVRVPTGNVNTSGEFEITKRNAGDGYVWGVELQGVLAVDEAWELFGSVAFQEGKVDTFPTSTPVEEREYIDRVMPLTGRLGARWSDELGRGWAETALRLAGDADKLSTRDEGDTQRIPPGGTPGYAILDLRGGWRLSEVCRLELALENVFDEDYRVHGSGTNAPGRNLIVGLGFAF